MYLSIDPGITGTGWALWNVGDDWHECRKPWSVGIWNPPGKLAWEDRALWLGLELWKLNFVKERIDQVWIEYPAFFETAGGTMVARRGDLLKLTYCVGVLAGVMSHHGKKIYLIPVRSWKGQLPKEVVERRVRRLVGDHAMDGTRFRSHIYDAVGLGLFAKGCFR